MNFRQRVMLIIMTLISMTSFGCALHPIKFYEGSQLRKDQVSFINIASDDVKLEKINDIQIKTLAKKKFELLPGEHKLIFSYGRIPFKGRNEVVLSFLADAGQVYNIYTVILRKSNDHLFPKTRMYLWIEKHKSREVVGGYYPGKPDFWGTYENTDWEKGYKW